MIPVERALSISVRIRPELDQAQRIKYIEEIKPYVQAAREAYRPLLIAKIQEKIYNAQRVKLEAELAAPDGSEDIDQLISALIKVNQSSLKLRSSREISLPRDQFRVKANQLIAQVNHQKARFALDNNQIGSLATRLISIPQIPSPEGRTKFEVPHSPVQPHNDLGVITIYRTEINPRLLQALLHHLQDQNKTATLEKAQAILYLVPTHFISDRQYKAIEFRHEEDIARQVVEISDLVDNFNKGLLQPPSTEELGKRSLQQNEYIKTHLRALLASFLNEELTNPNRSEKDLQKLYQSLGNYIRRVAEHITPRGSRVEDSYEKIGKLIEDLPSMEGQMLVSRLSTNLYTDLGLPCIDYLSETRLGEVIRECVMSGRLKKGMRNQMELPIFNIPEKMQVHLDKVIDSIYFRMEQEELDCQKLFEALDSLDYSDIAMHNLFRLIDDEQRDVLLKALDETSYFVDARRAWREKDEDDEESDFRYYDK